MAVAFVISSVVVDAVEVVSGSAVLDEEGVRDTVGVEVSAVVGAVADGESGVGIIGVKVIVGTTSIVGVFVTLGFKLGSTVGTSASGIVSCAKLIT